MKHHTIFSMFFKFRAALYRDLNKICNFNALSSKIILTSLFMVGEVVKI